MTIIASHVNNPPPEQVAQSGDSFPCQNCGAKLLYDATVQAMKCPYCGAQQAIVKQQGRPLLRPGREIPLEEGMRLAARGLGTPVTQVNCKDCGATVNVTPGEQTAKCAFCGSQQVLAQEAVPARRFGPSRWSRSPSTRPLANKKFENSISGLWFRPTICGRWPGFRRWGRVHPLLDLRCQCAIDWNAEAGYYYYETSTTATPTGTSRRAKSRERGGNRHRGGDRYFDDTLICASKGLPPDLVAKFRSFDTKRLSPYKPEFLAGWRAEAYAIDLMPAWGTAQDEMCRVQQGRCAGDVPGDTHRNLFVQNHFSAVTFKHILLPIWIAAYRYKGSHTVPRQWPDRRGCR